MTRARLPDDFRITSLSDLSATLSQLGREFADSNWQIYSAACLSEQFDARFAEIVCSRMPTWLQKIGAVADATGAASAADIMLSEYHSRLSELEAAHVSQGGNA